MRQCEDCELEFNLEDMYCDESGDYCQECHRQAFIQGALSAGIPLSVIEGKTKLLDHFSQQYIDFKSNKKEDL